MIQDLREVTAGLRDRVAAVRSGGVGGSEVAPKNHTERGKLLVRDRVDRLFDPGSPLLELSPLAAYGMHDPRNEWAAPAVGIGTSASRIGAAVAVYLMPFALDRGVNWVLLAGAAVAAVGLLVTLAWGVETAGRSLSDASGGTKKADPTPDSNLIGS